MLMPHKLFCLTSLSKNPVIQVFLFLFSDKCLRSAKEKVTLIHVTNVMKRCYVLYKDNYLALRHIHTCLKPLLV